MITASPDPRKVAARLLLLVAGLWLAACAPPAGVVTRTMWPFWR